MLEKNELIVISLLEIILDCFRLHRIKVRSIIFWICLSNKLLIRSCNIGCFFSDSKVANKNTNTHRTSGNNNRNQNKPLESSLLLLWISFDIHYFVDHGCLDFSSPISFQIWCMSNARPMHFDLSDLSRHNWLRTDYLLLISFRDIWISSDILVDVFVLIEHPYFVSFLSISLSIDDTMKTCNAKRQKIRNIHFYFEKENL